MKLTAKQEAFAQGIADGLSQSDAYRKAYDTSKTKPEVIWSKASELMADGKVAARVAELQEALQGKALWTREMSVKALSSIATGSDKGSEIVAAVKELNAMHGYQAPVKSEVSVSGGLVLIPAKHG